MIIHVPNTGSFRSNSEMEILENPLEWLHAFQQGWLAHLEQTGDKDWSRYPHLQNQLTPSSRGIQLAKSRLLFITTAGGYFPGHQEPFECQSPLGDYSIRQLPTSTPVEKIKFAHPYFDHQYAQADPQVILPLNHLREMAQSGFIGSLAPVFVSLCGYQPHVLRVIKEIIPAILKIAKEQNVQAALIVPVGPLCIQSAGLIARALEVNYIASTLTTWDADLAYLTAPPRLTATYLPEGSPLGMPGDAVQQKRILSSTLKLLELDAPTGIVYLNETPPV